MTLLTLPSPNQQTSDSSNTGTRKNSNFLSPPTKSKSPTSSTSHSASNQHQDETRSVSKAGGNSSIENGNIKKELYMKRKRINGLSIVLGLFFAIFAVALISPIIVIVIHSLENQRKEGYVERVKQIAITAELLIRKQVEVSFGSLQIMSQVAMEWNYSIDLTRFNNFASRLTKDFPELNNFEYALTDKFVLQYIYPIAGLEFMIGHHMGLNTPAHTEIILDAVASKETKIFGPINMINLDPNSVAVIAQNPIFYPNGTFFGLSVELFEFMKLFEAIDLHTVLSGFQYQLYEYAQNQIFMQNLNGTKAGTTGTIGNTNVKYLSDSIERNMTVMNSNWKIILRPVAGWDVGSLLWLEVCIGIVVALVVFLLVMLGVNQLVQDYFRKKEYQYIQDSLEMKVKERTKDLAQSHSQLLLLLDRISVEEQRTKKIMNSLEDAVISIDSSAIGRIIHSNNAFYKNFGYTDSDLIRSLSISTFLPKLNINSLVNELKSQSDIQVAETTANTKTGLSLNVKVSISMSQIYTQPSTQNTGKIPTITVTDEKEKEMVTIRESKLETVYVILIHILDTIVHPSGFNEHYQNTNQMTNEFLEFFTDIESRKRFKEFCFNERNDENICFLEDVEFYKSLGNIQERVTMQEEMYSKYLNANSPKQLNISKKQLETHSFKISRGLGEFELFDELERTVIMTVSMDSFKRWQERERKNEDHLNYM